MTASSTLLNVSDATKITNGDMFTVTYAGLGASTSQTFEFKNSSMPNFMVLPGNVAIVYNPGDSAATLAADIVNAINGSSFGAGTASQNGTSVNFTGNPAVSLATTNVYAEVDLEMKTKALANCEIKEEGSPKPYREDKGLMEFLRSL